MGFWVGVVVVPGRTAVPALVVRPIWRLWFWVVALSSPVAGWGSGRAPLPPGGVGLGNRVGLIRTGRGGKGMAATSRLHRLNADL